MIPGQKLHRSVYLRLKYELSATTKTYAGPTAGHPINWPAWEEVARSQESDLQDRVQWET